VVLLVDGSLALPLQEFAVSPVLFPDTKDRKVSVRLESCSGRIGELRSISILRRKVTIT